MAESQSILFVCVENAGRSQIAEAFFKKYSPKKFSAISAGTTPSSKINPLVIEVMKEIGIDVLDQHPKLLSSEMISNSFKTINMGCMDKESCPSLFVNDVIDWNVSDPKTKSIEEIRVIRDQIKIEVKNLLKSLQNES